MSEGAIKDGSASRRQVLLGVAGAGVAVPVLAACGSSSSGAPATKADAGPTTVKAGDIPVGGGRIFPDQQIVVTQPTAGDFKAFSAVCTHEGCIVNEVADKEIKCGCHFSRYSISDGHVEGGPAPSPLPEKTVKVSGDTLTVS